MKSSLLKFILVLIGILMLSAFLAPILHQILPYKFEKIFNRLVMIFTIAAAVFFVRVRTEQINLFGLTWTPDARTLYVKSFLLGFFFLAVLVIGQWMSKSAYWNPEPMSFLRWAFVVCSYLIAAMLIGFLEEFFFRGFILRTLEKELRSPLWLAVILNSALYSLVHFIGTRKPFIDQTPQAWDAFRFLAAPFTNAHHLQSIFPFAIGLFLFGIALNFAVLKTKSLYSAMAIHAGCVFVIKVVNALFDYHQPKSFLWGSGEMADGVWGWGLLAILAVSSVWFLPSIKTRDSSDKP